MSLLHPFNRPSALHPRPPCRRPSPHRSRSPTNLPPATRHLLSPAPPTDKTQPARPRWRRRQGKPTHCGDAGHRRDDSPHSSPAPNHPALGRTCDDAASKSGRARWAYGPLRFRWRRPRFYARCSWSPHAPSSGMCARRTSACCRCTTRHKPCISRTCAGTAWCYRARMGPACVCRAHRYRSPRRATRRRPPRLSRWPAAALDPRASATTTRRMTATTICGHARCARRRVIRSDWRRRRWLLPRCMSRKARRKHVVMRPDAMARYLSARSVWTTLARRIKCAAWWFVGIVSTRCAFGVGYVVSINAPTANVPRCSLTRRLHRIMCGGRDVPNVPTWSPRHHQPQPHRLRLRLRLRHRHSHSGHRCARESRASKALTLRRERATTQARELWTWMTVCTMM